MLCAYPRDAYNKTYDSTIRKDKTIMLQVQGPVKYDKDLKLLGYAGPLVAFVKLFEDAALLVAFVKLFESIECCIREDDRD